MKKFDMRNIKFRKVTVEQLDDRMLLMNLYATQALTFIIGSAWILFQRRNPLSLYHFAEGYRFFYWGAALAAAVITLDLLLSRWIPEEASDDGGVNERIFRHRPVWHIALIAFIVSVCEETLFRGAVQHAFGPYWTSIIFAAIHVRYLKHWIPTGLVFCISYALGWIYIQTGTLWAPITAHFIIDTVMGLIIKFRRQP